MKAIIMYIFIIPLLTSSILYAQWQSDVRLTHDTAVSGSGRRSILASGDYIHVAWDDSRNGEPEIYYKRSTNSGVSWSSDTRLTNAPGYSGGPTMAVYGSVVHLAWYSDRNGSWEIYYKRSTNNGLNWSSDIRLTNNIYDQYSVYIAAGTYVFIAWTGWHYGNAEISLMRSTNGGESWGTETRLTNNPARQQYPVLALHGPVVHVVFEDERAGETNTEIYYKRSTNSGLNWSSDTRFTNSSGQSWNPFIAALSTDVQVVWDDDRAGNSEIYLKRSTDEGVNWGTDTRLTNNVSASYRSSICLSSLFGHIVWTDRRDGHEEIYYKFSTNRGIDWGADTRLTSYNSEKFGASIEVEGFAVYAAWSDKRDGNYEIYYKRNPTGNPIGITKTSSEVPKEYSLSQNYPNPFNPVTHINFSIPKSSIVSLIVYDVTGREVSVPFSGYLNAGRYTIDYDASLLASGTYFYKIVSNDFVDVKKMVLVR